MVFASKPVTSLMRLAARPVGAQSNNFTPFAERMRRMALTIVVLPTPGPPVEVNQAPEMPARNRFETGCNETMVCLARYSGHDPKYKDETGKEREIEATALG
jgi:hypothetical protein